MAAKERATELAQQLRDAAKLQDPIAKAAVELVRLMGEAAKESLVSAEGNDMLRMQGEARTLRKLHKELTETPPSMNNPGA